MQANQNRNEQTYGQNNTEAAADTHHLPAWGEACYPIWEGGYSGREHPTAAIPIMVRPGNVAYTTTGFGLITRVSPFSVEIEYKNGEREVRFMEELDLAYCQADPEYIDHEIRPIEISYPAPQGKRDNADTEPEPKDAGVEEAKPTPLEPGMACEVVMYWGDQLKANVVAAGGVHEGGALVRIAEEQSSYITSSSDYEKLRGQLHYAALDHIYLTPSD